MPDVAHRVSRVPRSSGRPPFIVVRPGENIDSVAHAMAQGTYRIGRHEEIKAILIHNNKITETTPLRSGQLLNVSHEPCEGGEGSWFPGLAICPEVQGFSSDLLGLMQRDAQSLPAMMALSDQADGAGWEVGIDGPTAGGYIVLGADSGIAAGAHMLSEIRLLGRKIVEEATAKFGKEVMLSRQPAKLEMVQRFLRGNINYLRMQEFIAKLPKQLKSGLGSHMAPTPGVQAADARWVRRIVQVEEKGAARFFRSAGSLLEGKISRFETLGRGTTFVLPAVIGLYNIAHASPTERFRVGVEESVGIGLGALGTGIGVEAGTAICVVLGLTGVGAFLMVFVAAGAGAYYLSEGSKSGVRRLSEFFQ